MLRTGVAPLDDRLGGLRPGGLYLLSGPPGSGKLALTLAFLAEGIRAGERVALVSGSAPEDVVDLARHFGLELEEAWRSGRLSLVGFRGEYPRHIVHAADPGEAFAELDAVLGGDVSRVGVDPGTLLWEARMGTEMATRFLDWCASAGVTVMATVVGDLSNGVSQGTEWVLGRSAGAFRLEALPNGLRELRVLRTQPPVEPSGPITLEFARGLGIVAPSGRLDRRATDTPASGSRRLALLGLAPVPSDLEGWARAEYEVSEATDPLALVSILQDDGDIGAVVLYLDRSGLDQAIDVCRAVRPMTRGALLLVTDEEVRASDRARALDSGADDFLSGDVDVRELATRIRRAVDAGRSSRRVVEEAEEGAGEELVPIDAILPAAEFEAELRRRLAAPEHRLFTLLCFPDDGHAPGRLAPILQAHLRTDAGDVGGRLGDGYAALLQGARARQAQAFLERVARSLMAVASEGARIEAEILTSPADAGRIESRLAG